MGATENSSRDSDLDMEEEEEEERVAMAVTETTIRLDTKNHTLMADKVSLR
jgi:hypothetical protein